MFNWKSIIRILGVVMGGQKRPVYVADFETTTDPDDCRVWAYGLAAVETAETVWDVEIGPSIHRFCDRVSEENCIVYFHNLKFDSAFILDYLFRQGYRHTYEQRPRKGEFTSLISNMGAFYTVTVAWKNGVVTEFRDSLKKLPYSVKVVAQAFNLAEQKGDLDYHAYRAPGHIATAAERAYIAADVLIIARALKVQFGQGMSKLTVGSDALDEFKTILGKRRFDKLFPVLPEIMDDQIRAAYRGGWVLRDERWRGAPTRSGRVYDVNSLYPSVMYDRVLPYGEPIYEPGLPRATEAYPLFIVSVTFTAKLKPGHLPCIQVKGSSHFLATEYQTEITHPVTLSCSNVDLALWEEHYDMNILSYNGGWLFHGVQGLFTDYIDKWMEVKKVSTGGMRALAKLFLNSLYGKFATNPCITPKIPVFDYDNNAVKLVMGEDDKRDPVYTAMGVFITAYARDVTIRAAQENYDVFAYADTDSLHLLTDEDPENLWVDPHSLGAWKFEYAFESALFVRAKAYTERLDYEPHTPEECPLDAHGPWCRHVTHIAGMPDKVASKLTIDDFVGGRTFKGKLQPKRVPGGIVLVDIDFTMNME